MTRTEALAALEAGGEVTTAMLEPLGVSMDTFLRYAQRSDADRVRIAGNLLRLERARDQGPDAFRACVLSLQTTK
jgi:hypothetical protein